MGQASTAAAAGARPDDELPFTTDPGSQMAPENLIGDRTAVADQHENLERRLNLR